MKTQRISIGGIPAIVWGEETGRAYLYVHGKLSRKEYAEDFALIAREKGYATLSFDLPEHGERAGKAPRCDVWSGVRDLGAAADLAFSRWGSVSLFACSLGAYFSLNAYPGRPFERCLFLSPVVDMKWLVERMMEWNGVTPERLEREGEIAASPEPLRWDYYTYILSHPATRWPVPTKILYGALDELQPIESLRAFSERFGADLTVAERSRHAFMESGDGEIVRSWLRENI